MVIRCVVPGCRSTSLKGFLLKRFPRDSERRDLWYANIPKRNWEPTDNTYICEIHFEDHHWEQNRVDRLKSSAVPTIFATRHNYVKRRQRLSEKTLSLQLTHVRHRSERLLMNVNVPKISGTHIEQQDSKSERQSTDNINRNKDIGISNMENRSRVNFSEDKNFSKNIVQSESKEDIMNVYVSKKDSRKNTSSNNVKDEKDLLIEQLQEQITKQRECISHYESIVQLMNYRLMKLKKVLKAHQLLGDLD